MSSGAPLRLCARLLLLNLKRAPVHRRRLVALRAGLVDFERPADAVPGEVFEDRLGLQDVIARLPFAARREVPARLVLAELNVSFDRLAVRGNDAHDALKQRVVE